MIAKPGLKMEVVAGDAHGITLNDLQAFIDHVRRIAPDLLDSKVWGASFGQEKPCVLDLIQVRGDIPEAPDVQVPDAMGC